MTISWGQMGELWGRRIITVYVRDSRYIKEGTPIDRLYSKYALWVTSNGTQNTDWYK